MGENMILSRLEGVKARFEEVGQLITDPSVIADMKRYVKLNREYKQLEPVVEAMDAYRDLLSNMKSARTDAGRGKG
jgi:peptide chain release factor 1